VLQQTPAANRKARQHRNRNAKIVATLGPASGDRLTIQALFEAGADVFRLNLSHGTHEDHRQRLGAFVNGSILLKEGDSFRLDLDRDVSGDQQRASMPHPEIFHALSAGTDLLLDDGRVRLRVERFGFDFVETRVMLSAESASGKYPLEAVRMMNIIIAQTEADQCYREETYASQIPHRPVPARPS
jgi:pyruvate kinase